MSTRTHDERSTVARIDPATRLGPVHLTVASLDRMSAFFQEVLGFRLHWREGEEAGIGAGGEDLLRLREIEGARRVHGTTGLYHTAILVPTRRELAQLLRNIGQRQGLVDHGTHLAIYLPDAEGNGMELAWDRPREGWPMRGDRPSFITAPLDGQDLLRELEGDDTPWPGLHPDTRVGHVHLRVADLDAAVRFYHESLGLDVVLVDKGMGAAFFSAGGYHHHIAVNIWAGIGAPPPPPEATGLRYVTLHLPTEEALEAVRQRLTSAGVAVEKSPQRQGGLLVRDPSQNGVLLDVAPPR